MNTEKQFTIKELAIISGIASLLEDLPYNDPLIDYFNEVIGNTTGLEQLEMIELEEGAFREAVKAVLNDMVA